MPRPLTAPAHPYDPAALATLGRDRVATDAAHAPVVGSRPAIVVRYGCDPHGRGQWVATLKRGPRERAARLAVPAADGPDAAAAALIARQGLPWRILPAPGSLDGGESYAYVIERTPGEGLALAHGDRAALALAACQELLAALAGGGDADSLALPAALARQATGAAPIIPTVSGWAMGPRGGALTLTDTLARPIDGLSFGGELSPAGAMAAARAAGWALTAPMAALADRWIDTLGMAASPAAVAQALSARGGCPAVITTLAPERGLL